LTTTEQAMSNPKTTTKVLISTEEARPITHVSLAQML